MTKTVLFTFVCLFVSCTIFSCDLQSISTNADGETLTDFVSENPYLPEGIHVRMITLALHANKQRTKTGRWMLNEYTAQDILKYIEELKPDCLERFITGKQDPNMLVPVDEGEEPMTVVDFLNAAVKAGSEKCIIVPKLNMKWNEEYFFEAAQNLYDLPLEKPIRNINLDCWPDYWKEHSEEEIEAMLKRVKDIGYEVIGINMTGAYHEGFGYVDYMDFNIDKEKWEVNVKTLNRLKSDPELDQYFMYIDYPGAMNEFRAQNTADEQADIYTNNIYPSQFEYGYTFVYALFQDDWDARQLFTSEDGPYNGKSIYDVIKDLILKTRQEQN